MVAGMIWHADGPSGLARLGSGPRPNVLRSRVRVLRAFFETRMQGMPDKEEQVKRSDRDGAK